MSWRFVKKLGHWGYVAAKYTVTATAFFIGLAGIPDDLSTWEKWIDDVATDPMVVALAERAVEVANFVNQFWVRSGLVIVGILVIIWPLKRFWRFRHKIVFRWRNALSAKVWISRKDAIEVVRASHWAKLKEPNVIRHVSFLDSFPSFPLSKERTVYGMSDQNKALLKFNLFLEKVIDGFSNRNPEARRESKSGEEIDEAMLRKYLKAAVDEEIADEFGPVPDFKIT